MKFVKTGIATFLAGVMMLLSPMVMPALAGDPVIDAAKSEGIVGEKIDGYLGIVGSADPAVQRKVDEINAKRRSVYADLAQKEGQPLSVVARLTGEKLVAGEPSGAHVYDDSGQWVVKP
ncbi:MAG: hypothetical protein CMK06_09415 [Ponticaulis sp.]|nr:hypothetical protein [Ponticaulis sp.]|tara:strand:- start:136 stop:492 length:357 start_codon:yes stop_codon:yes gene_type:complete